MIEIEPIIQIFNKFLAKNHGSFLFMNNISSTRGKMASPEDVVKFCKEAEEGDPEEYLQGAFDWSDTDEGYDFWEYKHLKWRKFCEDNNLEDKK